MKFYKKMCCCLLLVLTVSILFFYSYKSYKSYKSKKSYIEGYKNGLAEPGKYPSSEIEPLLKDSYPFTGQKSVSNNSYNNIWWNYPIFKVGSFTQITNNLRYRKNPDDGVCITADFCGALYNDADVKTNVSKPLEPSPLITPDSVRVGYYVSNHNLFLGTRAGPELPTL